MLISILTLFPEMFVGPLSESILKKAQERKLLTINYINIRTFGIGKHKIVDDKPYGGGVGMLMRVDVLKNALESAKCENPSTPKKCKERIILFDPKGKTYSQKAASELATYDHLILVCPHYEGVDERFKKYIDEEISIGDYVLTGGEIPAMAVIDSVARLVPGILGKAESTQSESFQEIDGKKLLEYPQYTRPEEFEGMKVPEILTSGNHKRVSDWKKKESLNATEKRRPDLLKPIEQ